MNTCLGNSRLFHGSIFRAKTSMGDTKQHARPSFPASLFKRTAALEKDLKWYHPFLPALELDCGKLVEIKGRHRAGLTVWFRHLSRRAQQLADYWVAAQIVKMALKSMFALFAKFYFIALGTGVWLNGKQLAGSPYRLCGRGR